MRLGLSIEERGAEGRRVQARVGSFVGWGFAVAAMTTALAKIVLQLSLWNALTCWGASGGGGSSGVSDFDCQPSKQIVCAF